MKTSIQIDNLRGAILFYECIYLLYLNRV